MTDVPLSRATEDRLMALFAPVDQAEARRLLIERCGSNLADYADADSESLERIRFAALKVSDGHLAALAAAVDLAIADWRDLLVAAEFARNVNEHKSWFPHSRNG